jgi:hypothetical protein
MAYFAYTLASLRDAYPELGVNDVLSATGRRFLRLAERQCVFDFEKSLRGTEVSGWFTRPVSSLPGFARTIRRYMAMPESGFDRPFFMGHGRNDADVPYGLTAPYVDALRANDEPLTFKAYDADHSGTLLRSQRDTHPFVRRLFRG